MSSAHRHIARRRIGRKGRAVRRRRISLFAALFALLLGFAVAMPVPDLGGTSVAVAAVQRAKSFIELMRQRSPGKRLVAHLAKTKHRKLAMHERALPKARKRPRQIAQLPPFPSEIPPAFVDLVAPPLPVEMASLEAVPVGPFELPTYPSGYFYPIPGGYIFPPTEVPGPPPIIRPPLAGVPEPTTWAFMLLGFSLIGWSLRRSPDREKAAA